MSESDAPREPRAVLVTGASRFLGGSVAAMLAAHPTIERVIAVDCLAPSKNMLRRLGRAEFVRADIRNPMIGKIIRGAEVDTVVHTDVHSRPGEAGGRAVMKDMNVIGALHLFAACQKAPTVRRLVVRSTSAVYGYSPRNPARFGEEMAPKNPPRGGFSGDSVEIESYARGAGRRRSDLQVSILRFAPLIGVRMDTELTRYFGAVLVPSVFGYDPRIQLLHEDDALGALECAVAAPAYGTFNIAGDGTMSGAQAVRRAGRLGIPLPSPMLGVVGSALRAARVVDYSHEELGFLSQGVVLDTTRMRTELGFTPRWSTVDAFDDFVRGRSLDPVIDPAMVHGWEERLTALARRLPV
ncbi:NAD-dependent epimerase/dehydratase family protein [Tomitella gaofuii]|uniref:NAD-dependent epimerase/dehydratase family protein n=1 Tax=Tomitella gaofuii TaxID=2760083 RepID=UPI0015FB7E22|nr:NAD-dependent epimerase/dehydratase family protein [Tomitella gaofuii]